ncbi:hypothetical protein L6164_026139 [Bauhinia variegata]|uniref:Uncharacterized protein n=1 Tax=Bauhinia variegata TaxID=167791 RepID=A0ACB9LPR1_BAUVA|nr:hypothetical protein L6164_026139 [Bauhinia variegata]
MGQKQTATQEEPSSSSEEEEEVSSEEEDSSEEEEEEEQHKRTEPSVPPPPPPPKSSSTVAQPASSSEDEEEEGSSEEEEDSSSEEEPKQTEPSKKPTGAARGSPKQPESSESGSSESQKSHSFEISDRKKNKRTQPSVTLTPARSTMNNASENSCPTNDSRGVKRKLFQHKASDALAEERITKTEEKPSIEPKKLFQRVWSEEDEIALLKGVAEYWEKNSADPCKVQNAFHDFIKESFNVNFSKSQLIDKIRRLKKKYENNARKGKNGEDPKFSNVHEEELFELSKKIWATEGTSGGAPKPKPNLTSRIQQPSQKAKLQFRSLNADEVAEMNKFLGISEWHVDGIEKGLQLVEASKREELREKLNNLKFRAVLKSIVKRAKLMSDEANLVWEAVNSSRDH